MKVELKLQNADEIIELTRKAEELSREYKDILFKLSACKLNFELTAEQKDSAEE